MVGRQLTEECHVEIVNPYAFASNLREYKAIGPTITYICKPGDLEVSEAGVTIHNLPYDDKGGYCRRFFPYSSVIEIRWVVKR